MTPPSRKRLRDAFEALEPGAQPQTRMEARVMAAYQADQTSLVAEWLELFQAGALWLCWLEVDGEPVAAIYNIVWNNEVRFYQSGRKINLPKKVRAGLVIHACAIRESIERGYTRYDFLSGTTRYKLQLASNVRPLVRLTVSRSSMRTRLRGLGRAGRDLGRTLRDQWRARQSRISS